MASENKSDLIDRQAFIEDIKTEIMNLYLDGMKGTPRPRSELYDIIDRINEQPSVDAVVLPCEVGTQIWLTEWHCSGMRWMKLIEPKPRNIHHFDITKYGVFAHFKDGCINIKYFGESVFLTKEEAKAALAKRNGDGNG